MDLQPSGSRNYSGSPNQWISKPMDLQTSGSPNQWISKPVDLQTSGSPSQRISRGSPIKPEPGGSPNQRAKPVDLTSQRISKPMDLQPSGSRKGRGLSERTRHAAETHKTNQRKEPEVSRRHEPKRMQFKRHHEPVGQCQLPAKRQGSRGRVKVHRTSRGPKH